MSPILVVPHPGAANHNGGSLAAWQSNAELLLGTGDGGGAGDGSITPPASQSTGKVPIVEVNKRPANGTGGSQRGP